MNGDKNDLEGETDKVRKAVVTAGAESLRRERNKIVPMSERWIKQGQLTLRWKKRCEKLRRERKCKADISKRDE